MPELEQVKTRLNLSRPFEELPTRNHYSHAQRDAGSVQARTWGRQRGGGLAILFASPERCNSLPRFPTCICHSTTRLGLWCEPSDVV